MKSRLKRKFLDRHFPLLAVENGAIVGKDASITVGFRVELPEIFTISSEQYDAIHSD